MPLHVPVSNKIQRQYWIIALLSGIILLLLVGPKSWSLHTQKSNTMAIDSAPASAPSHLAVLAPGKPYTELVDLVHRYLSFRPLAQEDFESAAERLQILLQWINASNTMALSIAQFDPLEDQIKDLRSSLSPFIGPGAEIDYIGSPLAM